MNWRKRVYLPYAWLRGYRFPTLLSSYLRQYERGLSGQTVTPALRQLLQHCRDKVPYYAKLSDEAGVRGIVDADPHAVLQRLPILTKAIIRENFDRLQSNDLSCRKWHYNTSGGSTGEPVRLIQDREHDDRTAAISRFFNTLLGCNVGEPIVRLWGSQRDLESGTQSRKARFFNWLTNTTWMNAFQMSSERIREFIHMLNRLRPRLIVAYPQAAYELARFTEREQIAVVPQRAMVTSAGNLYPFMREKIQQVFGCKVYDMYGTREVSDIACELPGLKGLWVAPWGNYVEIVDDAGHPVPPGTEGNIVVTSLTNYAMPLLRYWIGDRGALLPQARGDARPPGTQVLQHVSGRVVDVFRKRDQTLVDAGYFILLLYFRSWVGKFQVIQKAHTHIVFKIVRGNGEPVRSELDEIEAKARLAMGSDCRIDFEFVQDLPPYPSGKYRYMISEVSA